MVFKDGRGLGVINFQKIRRKENVAKVRAWLAINPNGTPTECSESVGLSLPTIYSIAKELKTEADNAK